MASTKANLLMLLAAAGCAFGASAAGLLDVPVSSVANPLYLSSMDERPWWNKDWKRRAPVLISSAAEEAFGNAVVDVVVDFGEKVNPGEVRLVTPWETEIPVVCEAKEGTTIELIFKTPLRIRENRPFLVYWANPQAPKQTFWPSMSMTANADEIRIANGLVDVTFDNLHRTPGLIKTLRVVGSQAPNELLERATGYAWKGFDFRAGGDMDWSGAQVVADNAFKKQIRFESARATLDFTVYADQPRVDYAYRLKQNLRNVHIGISWACGGGVAYDELCYQGAHGATLVLPAALDHVTDCVPHPSYRFGEWISTGWYALRDRRVCDTVGHVFDRSSLSGFSYWGHGQAAGESCNLTFSHTGRKGETASGAGALVALMGDVRVLEAEYRRLKSKPAVFTGRAQSCRDFPVKIARLDHDYCADFNIGPGAGAGWASGEPLEGTGWAENVAAHLRSYGATVIRFGGYNWQSLPITRKLYGEILAAKDTEYSLCQKAKYPEWKEGAFDGAKFREAIAAAHAKGLGVNIWGSFLAGVHGHHADMSLDPRLIQTDWELQSLYAKCGVDGIYNAAAQGEGPLIPQADLKARGRSYWLWDRPEDFFKLQDVRTQQVKDFYREAKKRNPEKPVVMWNSENGELSREMLLTEQAGFFDTVMCEILPHGDVPHVKHVAKRLRALFNNESHTVHHHYYFFKPDHRMRVSEIELPFVCGVNGFSHENLTYENYDRALSEIIADFHRFAEYTRLGEKVARMAPVKNVAVFRDCAAFRDDIIKRRTGHPYPYRAQQDGRVRAFGELKNFSYDVVINRYFTRADLAQYRAVYIPEDPVFSDALAEELLAYVRSGGGAVIEGATAESPKLKALGLGDKEVRTLGKGRIMRFEMVMTDHFRGGGTPQAREAVAALASVGGQAPYTVESDTVDSVLQASDEGLFLGCYNPGKKAGTGKVRIAGPVKPDLFVLDVKNGTRRPFTGEFEVAVGAEQTGFYLIGDDRFTAIPETVKGVWAGAGCAVSNPNGRPVTANTDTAFRPARAVEFVSAYNGRPILISRPREALIDCRPFCKEPDLLRRELKTDDLESWQDKNPKVMPFDREKFTAALATAAYVHIMAPTNESDVIFTACADGLKALLKRGGAILFDKVATGPAAHRFLEESGVFDPNANGGRREGIGDTWGEWTAATNHPLYAASRQAMGGLFQYRAAFAKWDAAKQFAPLRAKRDNSYAMLVLQENVLGKGRVMFAENGLGFTDWYENQIYGNNILSWFIGMSVKQHREKVVLLNGGPGEVMRLRAD